MGVPAQGEVDGLSKRNRSALPGAQLDEGVPFRDLRSEEAFQITFQHRRHEKKRRKYMIKELVKA